MAVIKRYHSDNLKINSLHALTAGVTALRIIGTGGYQSPLRVRQFLITGGVLSLQHGHINDTYTVPAGTTITKIEVYNIVADETTPYDLIFTADENTVIVNTSIVTVNNLEVER